MYAAIDLATKLILDIVLFGRRGTDLAAAFLHGLAEKHDLSDAEFLVDGAVYLAALSRLGLSGHSTMSIETASKNGFTLSKCESTASINRGSAVGRAPENDLNNLPTTIIHSDRTSHSTNDRQQRC